MEKEGQMIQLCSCSSHAPITQVQKKVQQRRQVAQEQDPLLAKQEVLCNTLVLSRLKRDMSSYALAFASKLIT